MEGPGLQPFMGHEQVILLELYIGPKQFKSPFLLSGMEMEDCFVFVLGVLRWTLATKTHRIKTIS
jgi:hypothetical protein